MITFFINAISLGIGLAMDAFSISLANGLFYPSMKIPKRVEIAGAFAFFQFIMPLIGWFCIHTVINYFKSFQSFTSWIAFFLLCYIGIKMIIDGRKASEEEKKPLDFKTLIIQGIATSIDALSVGFTIANDSLVPAVVESIIIGLVTFIICYSGLYLGNKVGNRFQNKAVILGGLILIIIGLEILIKSFY